MASPPIDPVPPQPAGGSSTPTGQPRGVLASSVGPVGIWTAALDALPVPGAAEAAGNLEALGYGALWFPEAYGREAFTTAALLLDATRRMPLATGIASIYARDPVTANAAARTVLGRHPGRLVTGLGVSHAPLVERMRGHHYGRPLAAMAAYLDAMDAAGFLAVGPEERPPRVLAALGPRMLELARDRADGAHTYLVTPEHTAWARATLGPDRLLAVEQTVVLATDPATVRARAHWHLAIYTGLANYRASWGRLGFGEADFVRGGSERLQQALVVAGEQAIARRVREHLDAGADHVCLQVLGEHPGDVPTADWQALAPTVGVTPTGA